MHANFTAPAAEEVAQWKQHANSTATDEHHTKPVALDQFPQQHRANSTSLTSAEIE